MQEEQLEAVELPLDDMRRVQLEKKRAREAERVRVSKLATKIVVSGALLLVGAVLCFPSAKPATDPAAAAELARKAAQVQAHLADPQSDSMRAVDLLDTAPRDAHASDLEFAADLIRFMQPGAPQSKSSAEPPDR